MNSPALYAKSVWHAHPDLTEEQILRSGIDYYYTTLLKRISNEYLKQDQYQRELLLKNLSQRGSLLFEVAGLNNNDLRGLDYHLRRAWERLPSTRFDDHYTLEKKLDLARGLKKVLHDHFGIQESSNPLLKPFEFTPHNDWAFEEEIQMARDFCDGESSKVIERLSGPASSLHQKIAKLYLNFEGIRDLSSRLFLGTNNCEDLVNDIAYIVRPHFNPYQSSHRSIGQLEATDLYLLEKFMSSLAIRDALTHISTVQRWKNWKPFELIEYLTPNLSKLERLRLVNFAGHNHSFEMGLIFEILETSNNPSKELRRIKSFIKGINRIYEIFKYDSYHYWSGAMVSCELLNKKYSKYVSKEVSSLLGKLYELNTEENVHRNRDIQDHINGANFGIKYCEN